MTHPVLLGSTIRISLNCMFHPRMGAFRLLSAPRINCAPMRIASSLTFSGTIFQAMDSISIWADEFNRANAEGPCARYCKSEENSLHSRFSSKGEVILCSEDFDVTKISSTSDIVAQERIGWTSNYARQPHNWDRSILAKIACEWNGPDEALRIKKAGLSPGLYPLLMDARV
jgi:hypothetical protein